jgi:hypothetical protein
MVGHKHNLQDQIFSVLSRYFRRWTSFIFDMRRQAAECRDAFQDETNKPNVSPLGPVSDTCQHLAHCLTVPRPGSEDDTEPTIAGLANAENSDAGVQHSYTCKLTGGGNSGIARAVRCQYKKYNHAHERYPRQKQRGDQFTDEETGQCVDAVLTVYNKQGKFWETLVQFGGEGAQGGVKTFPLPVWGFDLFPGTNPPSTRAPLCPMDTKWPTHLEKAKKTALKAKDELHAMKTASDSHVWWASFLASHAARIAVEAAAGGGVKPPYYHDAKKLPHLREVIQRSHTPGQPARPAQPPPTVLSYQGADPVLNCPAV